MAIENVRSADRARPRHIVVTVHGIRTFGGWQSRLARLVQEVEPDCEFKHFKFNYFNLFAFWFWPTRWIIVRRFTRAMLRISSQTDVSRIDVVGHSFGTYVAARGLRRLTGLKVNTLILSGSVLKSSHFWDELIPSRVGRLINECGHRDGVLILSQALVPLTGMAGRVGFVGLIGSDFQNRYHAFGHSGYFQNSCGQPDDTFMRRHWVPLLTEQNPITEIDERGEATPLVGIQLTLLQWLDPVKMTVIWTLLGAMILFLVGLWAEAALTRVRASAVRSLLIAASERNAAVNSIDVAKVLLARNLVLKTSYVLWVDDGPDSNRLERRALRRWNVCFINVRSTAAARSELQSNPSKYSLVISDWARGQGDSGEQTALALRDDTLPKLPLIFYVSPTSVNDEHREHVKRLGAIDQTGDPFTLAALSLVALSKDADESSLDPQFALGAVLSTGAHWIYRRLSACDDK